MPKEQVVWGLHIKNVNGDWPIASGLIAIGWHELGNVAQIAPTRQAFKTAYAAAIPNSKPGTIPVSAGQIFRFVHEMQVGDIVVYASRHDRMINIGRVTGTYEYILDAEAEYPHPSNGSSISTETNSRRAPFTKSGRQ